MAQTIRTRKTNRDIKALDKTMTAAERMKNTYVRAKDSAGQARGGEEQGSPVEYAEDRVARWAEHTAHESANQIKEKGGRALHYVKEKRRIAGEIKQIRSEPVEGHFSESGECPSQFLAGGENPYQPKEQIFKTARAEAGRKNARKKAAERAAARRAEQRTGQTAFQEAEKRAGEIGKQAVKTIDRGERTIKTTHRAGQTVKSAGKGTVKAAGKSVKTTGQTAKITVKTTEQAARNAYRTAKASAKAAEKSARAAKQAAKAGAKSARAAAKAAATAAKGIIAATKALVTAIAAGGWVAVLILIIVILFGAVLCSIGGDNSSTVSPVSAEVQAYEPLIRKYARQYGIGEYVELIKAVMMQESGGNGSDPMQSSEGSFNTKYPRKPNGITDPEYSIECGVQELKNCLERAKTESPVDMPHIKLALQGYNYGNGYIEWADENYGGYTLANAAEFSEKMAKEKGWDSYGDRQYVPHVLRYYSFGRIPTGAGNQMIVQMALSQEGNAGDTYWRWYGFTDRVSWCACFTSWCADQCGYIESGAVPKFSLCSDGVKWFQEKKQFQDGSYVPVPGDIIFFDWGNDGSIDHVGIVENVKKGVVNTIEGNSGDKVKRNSYPVGSDSIYGYGIPAYQ